MQRRYDRNAPDTTGTKTAELEKQACATLLVLVLQEECLEVLELGGERNREFGALQIGREAVGELWVGPCGARHDVRELRRVRGSQHESLRRLGVLLVIGLPAE